MPYSLFVNTRWGGERSISKHLDIGHQRAIHPNHHISANSCIEQTRPFQILGKVADSFRARRNMKSQIQFSRKMGRRLQNKSQKTITNVFFHEPGPRASGHVPKSNPRNGFSWDMD